MSAEKIVHILVPMLLSAILGLLGWMGNSLNKISEGMAVVTYRVNDHGERISALELWRRDMRRR